MLKRSLTRLGFVVATVGWTVLLYGALTVSLGDRIAPPTLIALVLVMALAVAVAARAMRGKVY